MRPPTYTLARSCAALALLSLCACGGSAPAAGSAPPQAATAAAASGDPAATSTQSADELPCAALQEPIARLLEREVALSDATVRDLQTNAEHSGCRLTATGTAAEWGDVLSASRNLALVLTQRGWGPGVPLADGPTGSVVGFADGSRRLQLAADWQPAPGASCPADQPIAACTIPPDQQIITIVLEGY